MARTLELGNSANWDLVWTESFTGQVITPTFTNPIPEISVPVIFDKHVLAVGIQTDVPEGKQWFWGGYLYQKFQLGLIIGSNPNSDTISRRSLDVNTENLIIFPKYLPTYAVTIRLPKWFKDTTTQVTIWEYIGIDVDSVDAELSEIKQKLMI